MAYPTSAVPGVTYATDKTADTFQREVDQKLWAAMQAKSPFLDMLDRPKIGNRKFEWEVDSQPVGQFTLAAGTTNTIVHSVNSTGGADASVNVTITGSTKGLEVGTLMRNVSRATPVGTYSADEIMRVASITSDTVFVVDRAYTLGVSGVTTGNNSTAHATGDVLEIIYTPKPEGSSPDANKYTDVTLDYNFANTVDFYLTVTGDQLATDRLVAGDNIQNQFAKNLLNLSNQMERMLFYGLQQAQTLSTGTPTGAIMRTKGLDQFLSVSGANYDITTKDVTPAVLDKLLAEIVYDKTDPTDKFVIACHPANARKVSAFGIDKVRTTQEMNKYGRYVDTFMSDLGVTVPVIWSLNISRSDLFILDMDKISLPMFRAFEKAEWSYGDDGVDAWRQRYLGSFGVKCVDAKLSHAKLGFITW